MKYTALFTILLAATGIAAEGDIIGKIGDMEINVEDVRTALGKLGAAQEAAISKDPSLLNQAVRTLLVQKLLLKEARSKKWEDEAAVKAQLERAREAAIGESYLQSISTPPDSYPSDAELQAAYDSNKAALLIPKQFHLAQIFVANPKDADKASADKAKAKLDDVLKRLKAKEAFAVVASSHSEESQSAGRGGEIGWLTEAQIQPEIRQLVPTLALNAVSDPIKLEDGWHIVKLLDTKAANTPALDQIKDQLVQQMRAEKAKANSQAYLAKLLQENPLAINELELAKVLKKSGK